MSSVSHILFFFGLLRLCLQNLGGGIMYDHWPWVVCHCQFTARVQMSHISTDRLWKISQYSLISICFAQKYHVARWHSPIMLDASLYFEPENVIYEFKLSDLRKIFFRPSVGVFFNWVKLASYRNLGQIWFGWSVSTGQADVKPRQPY